MEWLENLNKAINYIEEHLTDEIDLHELGKVAGCSGFHFQRMFSYMAETPLSEYIRRRKMSLAAVALQNGEKVLDVALKYGYDSPTAFNRAFQSVHGFPPSNAKSEGVTLKAFPPISFKITIKGEAEMNYKIEKKEAFRIVGVKEHYPMNLEESFEKVPQFWQKTTMEGAIPRILALMDQQPVGLLGISTCMDGNSFDYYIAVSSDRTVPEGMSEYTVPECTWAIFECVGPMPHAIQSLQKRIVTEWLPTSGYEYANAPDIEVYFEGDQSSDDYKCEVWLPVTKK
ncbi:AraC family transcriptional regulator [Desulfitobacterium sp. PCE1]|uniref:AraC family transcriptional regulator n=1 Tax=Desulfitobacterium sp. PCE1 TaxID=146907 RepID=UPI00037FEB07|nr:AraC family transcriptional regulator [Desulfitobacterium sp. PCE1]